MKSISYDCPNCKKYFRTEARPNTPITCPGCSTIYGRVTEAIDSFSSCSVCQCKQFYIQKDFNQFIGCLVMLIGIILVPKSYGLSLPVFALIDWLLYRKVKTMVICYKCGAEYRGIPSPEHLKPFLHHIGAKYDKFRK